jgi:DNA-binding CsgD family transcriptional regulator
MTKGMDKKEHQIDSVSKTIFFEYWDAKKAELLGEFEAVISFFEPYIKSIPKIVLGNYYWQIFDNAKPFPKIRMVGGDVEALTPTTAEKLLTTGIDEFFTFFHPNDLQPTMAFVLKVFGKLFELDSEQRSHFNFNIITRVRNGEGIYYWNSLQYPALYFDSDGNFLYGLALYTSIDHLMKPETEPALTILDSTNPQKQVFTCFTPHHEHGFQISYPTLTKREKEIVTLLGQGNASKQIAHILGIHKTTVDNHRQRLLKKFNASSSTELVLKTLLQ